MAIMITGGTGFLGAYLAQYLIKEQAQRNIVLFDRSPNFHRIAGIREHVTVVQGDVLEPLEVLGAMQKYGVDRIVHLAFIAGSEEPGRALPYLRFQCMATATVFDAARLHGIRRVVNASSHAVYGPRTDSVPVDEDMPLNPNGRLYGVCKIWTEQVAENYNERYDMEILSLRLNSAYGIGRVNRGTAWAGGLLSSNRNQLNYRANAELAALGHSVVMPPSSQMDDFLHASDTAQACWLALMVEKPRHHVFNVGNEHRPVGDYTNILRDLLPEAQISIAEEGRQFILLDTSRIREELGFRPRFTLEEGLAAYVAQVKRDAGAAPPVDAAKSPVRS